MRRKLRILSWAALVAAVVWAGFGSNLALVIALVVLLAPLLRVLPKKSKNKFVVK